MRIAVALHQDLALHGLRELRPDGRFGGTFAARDGDFRVDASNESSRGSRGVISEARGVVARREERRISPQARRLGVSLPVDSAAASPNCRVCDEARRAVAKEEL